MSSGFASNADEPSPVVKAIATIPAPLSIPSVRGQSYAALIRGNPGRPSPSYSRPSSVGKPLWFRSAASSRAVNVIPRSVRNSASSHTKNFFFSISPPRSLAAATAFHWIIGLVSRAPLKGLSAQWGRAAACGPRRRHGGYCHRYNWAHVELLLFPAAQASLRRLGQRGQADGDPGAWRPRPLPQLGLGRARVAPPLPSDRPRPSRSWRFRLGDWRQLRDDRSRARSLSVDQRDRRRAGHADRPFAGRGRRVATGRRISRFGQGAGRDRGSRAALRDAA